MDTFRKQSHDDPGVERDQKASHRPPHDVAGSRPVSTREAAALLGVSERTIRRAIARGELKAEKDHWSYSIDRDSLDRFAARTDRTPQARPLARVVAFPSNSTVEAAPLPDPLSSFIGRGADVATVLALLDDPTARLITLTGPGGIGKTRLAMAAASAIGEGRFPDGIAYVPLADIQQPEMVIPAIARALGLREQPGHNETDRLRIFLRHKQLLLVLDNFEHLLSAGSDVAALLSSATGTKALVTSRAPLRVMGEREAPVQPMLLAGHNATRQELLASDAGRLFVERALERDASFTVDEAAAPLIAAICSRLDGLPLAIELAAARVNVLPLHHLLARLDRRLPLLTRGPQNAPSRHRTMRDAIAWSYELLAPDEQRFFQRLAIFPNGATLEAAAAVCGTETGPREPTVNDAVVDTIASLTEQSLLIGETGLDGERRFRMLETIREFGLERLAATNEKAKARAALAGYMLALVSSFGVPELLAASKPALDRLEASHAELQTALAWLEEHDRAAFVQLVAKLPSYWYACSHYQEAQDWLARALRWHEAATVLDRARLEVGLSRFQVLRGEYQAAAIGFDRGIPVLQTEGRATETAIALMWRSGMAMFSGDDELAEASLAEACQVAERVADPPTRATLLGFFLVNLGVAARSRGEFDLAESRMQRALEHFQAHGNTFAQDGMFLERGDLALARGDFPLALNLYQTFLERMSEQGDLQIVEAALAGAARVATAWRQFEPAVRLFALADLLQQRLGLGMILPGDLDARAQDLATLRVQLDDATFTAAWDDGRSLSLNAALYEIAALAQKAPPAAAATTGSAHAADALTRREREILRLLAEHMSDREIATALYLGLRTVSWHVRSILAKLDVPSRRAAIIKARAEGLVGSPGDRLL